MCKLDIYGDTEYRLRQIADKYDTTVANVIDAIIDMVDSASESWEDDLDL